MQLGCKVRSSHEQIVLANHVVSGKEAGYSKQCFDGEFREDFMPTTTTKEIKPFGRQKIESGGMPRGAVVMDRLDFMDAQVAVIGRMVQGLMEEVLSRGQSASGVWNGPSQISSDRECGKSQLREREVGVRWKAGIGVQ